MKRYLNYIRIFSVLLITGAVLSACSDSDDIVKEEPQQPTGPKTYTMTVQASKGGEGTRALSLDESTTPHVLNATWDAGEEVTVYKGETSLGTLTAQSSGPETTLKGTLKGTINNGDELKLKFLSPSYASQDGTLEYIASHCDYAEANVTATVSGTSVTTDDANFVNQQAIVKFTLKKKTDNSNLVIPAAAALTISDGTNDYTVTPASATNVLFVAIPAISDKAITLTATDGGDHYIYEKSGVTFTQGKYYEITVKMAYDDRYTPLTFEAKNPNTTITFNAKADAILKFSRNGIDWETYSSPITLANTGDKVSFRGENNAMASTPSDGNCSKFSCDGSAYVYGNVMSLLSETEYPTATSVNSYAFCRLFYGCTQIYNHESKALVLPATGLSDYCYAYMFNGCSSLTSAPVLPAMTMADDCYMGMFFGCSGLTTAPALPATSLANACYQFMFSGCTSLGSAPNLPATILAGYCYGDMFMGCTGLTSAPALQATTLAGMCYYQMFMGCTNLTTAPDLPATTLSAGCYAQMFMNCTSLNRITCLATDISAADCTTEWLNNVAASGTFTKAASTNWGTGVSGIPSGWTIIPPIGALSGKFTVNASGKQVYFSKGNLRATTTDLGANWTWSFAEHQWDYVGNATANTAINGSMTVSTNGTVDLFGWNGNSSSFNNYGIYNSTTYSDYGNKKNEGLKHDWGYNAITNGGNAQNSGWRTLTYDEWHYLLHYNTGKDKYGYARVAGVYGIILLPDEFVDPMKNNGSQAFKSVSQYYQDFNGNIYTSEQWEAMEAAGVVFLPAAGSRNGTTVTLDCLRYWASDVYKNAEIPYCWYKDIDEYNINFGATQRQYGYSVRLVRDVN
ncbi:MAG: hypothetical protein J5658_02710 [Prevotella sp.]|nr:hypothetical protein [Prevotella sp.]